jgi:cyclopropane-fatty-acyl-phospholipid synthase
MSVLFTTALAAAEHGRLPDSVIRFGIRRLLDERVKAAAAPDCETSQDRARDFLIACRRSPIAVAVDRANEQHYEVPAEFFRQVLGPRLKYSCCCWEPGVTNLAAAEEAALSVTCARAHLEEGQSVLELGCGWGSLSLWMAETFPGSRITAVSNSASQKAYIDDQASRRGLRNLEVVTADMNVFDPGRRFDRVVSIEMFEHMRNHAELMRRIAQWLVPGGLLFVHIFCHRTTPYLFENNGPQDWMTRCFFEGGMMPSDSLLLHCQSDLTLRDHWRWSGDHYRRTSEAWLQQCDERRETILPIMQSTYGPAAGAIWLQRWRVFFMACAELFGYRRGQEWWVSHYLFERD